MICMAEASPLATKGRRYGVGGGHEVAATPDDDLSGVRYSR
jgi:hypothetical protein